MAFKSFASFIKVGRTGKFKTFTAGGKGIGVDVGYYRSARFLNDISGLRHPVFSAMRGKRILEKSLDVSLDVGAGLGDPVSQAVTMIDDFRLLSKGIADLLDELYSQGDTFYFSSWRNKAKIIAKSLKKIEPFKTVLKGFIIERTVYLTFTKTKNRPDLYHVADEISKAIGEQMKAELEKEGARYKEESRKRIAEGKAPRGLMSMFEPGGVDHEFFTEDN